MVKFKRGVNYVEKVSNWLEVAIAILLLLVIVIKVVESALNTVGIDVVVLEADFELILSSTLTLVIGIEFVKMLCRNTPDSVVDVLLFAIARQMVVYYEGMWGVLIGVAAIAGMFATKKFLVNRHSRHRKSQPHHTAAATHPPATAKKEGEL